MLEKMNKQLGLTNIEIDDFLKKKCSNYIGVFSPDTLSLKSQQIGSLVCNLSDSNQIGSHFIAIINQKDRVLYVDSFGIKCEIPKIRRVLNSLSKPIFFNNEIIQDINSSYCGFFVILFCLYFDKQRSFPLTFSTKLKENDKVCTQWIVELK